MDHAHEIRVERLTDAGCLRCVTSHQHLTHRVGFSILPTDEISIVVRQALPRSADAIINGSCLHSAVMGTLWVRIGGSPMVT